MQGKYVRKENSNRRNQNHNKKIHVTALVTLFWGEVSIHYNREQQWLFVGVFF